MPLSSCPHPITIIHDPTMSKVMLCDDIVGSWNCIAHYCSISMYQKVLRKT
uniref:Uncharacterized protein n=1 Tax=Arundo donax TaxID=35708 RepID=A0A0A9DQZ6_ARUDO